MNNSQLNLTLQSSFHIKIGWVMAGGIYAGISGTTKTDMYIQPVTRWRYSAWSNILDLQPKIKNQFGYDGSHQLTDKHLENSLSDDGGWRLPTPVEKYQIMQQWEMLGCVLEGCAYEEVVNLWTNSGDLTVNKEMDTDTDEGPVCFIRTEPRLKL